MTFLARTLGLTTADSPNVPRLIAERDVDGACSAPPPSLHLHFNIDTTDKCKVVVVWQR